MAEALGVAAAIAQFAGLGFKVIQFALDSYRTENLDGLPQDIEELRMVTRDLEELSNALQEAEHGSTSAALAREPTGDEIAIRKLSLESRKVAKTLIEFLSGLQGKDEEQNSRRSGKRKMKAVRVGVRLVLKKEEIKEQESRLQRIVQEMSMRTMNLLRHQQGQIMDSNTRIEKAIKQLTETLETVKDELAEQEVEMGHTKKTLDYEMGVTGLSELLDQVVYERSVVESLRFLELGERHSRIKDTHEGTVQWVFDSSRTHLYDWLQCGNGVFWIRGKAGSGKSTIMKFIAASPQTFQTLKKWAGPDTGKLVVAKHFFWITGTDMQKSIEGLYRSLLIQAFEQQPTLIYHVLPENCDTELWTMPMLKKALVALASLDEDLGYKFCFLIDGLDEYDKGANGHELDVVDVIKGLSKSAWIKLCVSSRPWTTFKVAFQDSPQLLVEEFTRADMKKFAWERLIGILPKSADEELDSWRGLAGEIAEKATGVWLWVYLVVKAMRRVVICDEGFDRAKESLDEFPADLGDYFRHIIERTDAQYRREGSRILLVALIAADLRVKFHLDGLCLLLQHPDDFCTPILNKSFQVSRALKSIETIRNRLNNRTRDLLDIEYVTNYDGWRASVETGYAIRTDEQRLNQYTISFLHRTVRDFLKEYYMEPLKRNSGPDFVPAIFLLCNEMVPLSCSNSDVAMTVSLAREHLQDCFSISSIVDRQLRLSLQNTDDHGNLQIRGEVYDDPRRFESSALVRRLKTIQKADGYGAKLIEQYVQLVQSLGDIAFGYGLTPAKIPGGSGCKHKLDKYVRTYLPAADILECPEYFQMLQDPLHAKGMAAIAVTSGLVLFAAAVYRENTPQTTFETLLYWLNAFYCTEKRIRPPCCTDGIMRSYCGQHLTSRHHLLKIRPNGTGEDGTLVEHIEPPAPSRSPVPDFDRLHYIHENAHFQLEMMALLLELGARPNITLQATATTNRSPWMQFLSYGLREETAKMAVLLLRYGADPHCGLFLNLFGKNMAAELVEQARIEGSLRATESDNGFFGSGWLGTAVKVLYRFGSRSLS